MQPRQIEARNRPFRTSPVYNCIFCGTISEIKIIPGVFSFQSAGRTTQCTVLPAMSRSLAISQNPTTDTVGGNPVRASERGDQGRCQTVIPSPLQEPRT